MVVYEVNLRVQPEIESAYREWLPGHIREVLRCPGFVSAEWFVDKTSAESAPVQFVVSYRVASRENLESYFAKHAPALRADGVARFGEKFSASRRILESKAVF